MLRYKFWKDSRCARNCTFRSSLHPFRLAPLLLLLLPILLTGCAGDDGGSPPQNGQHPTQPPVPVAVANAIRGSISSYYSATATLEAEKEADVLARVTGEIEALECEEGDRVSAGKVLLRIDNDEYRLRLAQAEASASSLRDRYNRLKEMWEQRLVSAEEYQNGLNELKSAEAEADLARLNLSYTRVTAPFAGRIVRRLVDIGQNVGNGTALFTISDFDPLLARVHVPSKEFKKLKPNQPVDLILDSNMLPLKGTITLISPIIDPASGTIKITIQIPEYPADTRPGDFAEVRIVTEQRMGTLLVPKTAVFTDRGDNVIYIAADSSAERRVVETGFTDENHTEILSGVGDGETVIVKGQRSLKHGAPIKIMSEQPGSEQQPAMNPSKQPGHRKRPGRKGSK